MSEEVIENVEESGEDEKKDNWNFVDVEGIKEDTDKYASKYSSD